jgi:hypothetical protein
MLSKELINKIDWQLIEVYYHGYEIIGNYKMIHVRLVVLDETNVTVAAFIGTKLLELTQVEESRIREVTRELVDSIPWDDIAAEQINHCPEYE